MLKFLYAREIIAMCTVGDFGVVGLQGPYGRLDGDCAVSRNNFRELDVEEVLPD